jgi:hypothetical protein
MEDAETVIITMKVSRESIETCMKYSARLVSTKCNITKETEFYCSTECLLVL